MKNSNLINARLKKGLTQEELAKMLGYTKAAVSNWENGVSIPRTKDAIAISRILEESVDYLFYAQNEQESHTKINDDKTKKAI
ncbi:helix-turn-helix transcriptional regulator [Bacillus sp. FJAT-52991]|uniref:Helix-turn-helix transcriptional regulator n=1 Tax=Bacillus kandeliae TaxID=3129297 RepID=A0ABZ2NAR1_9BACI